MMLKWTKGNGALNKIFLSVQIQTGCPQTFSRFVTYFKFVEIWSVRQTHTSGSCKKMQSTVKYLKNIPYKSEYVFHLGVSTLCRSVLIRNYSYKLFKEYLSGSFTQRQTGSLFNSQPPSHLLESVCELSCLNSDWAILIQEQTIIKL